MALFKCSKCGATKETRCKPKKCPECGEANTMVKVEAETSENPEKGASCGKKRTCKKKES